MKNHTIEEFEKEFITLGALNNANNLNEHGKGKLEAYYELRDLIKQCNSVSFNMTEKQVEDLKDWKDKLPKKQFVAIDYGYTYCITPTGLGDILIVKRADGFKINLTDYDKW